MKIVMLCDLYDEKLQYQENLLSKYYIKHGHEVTVLAATFDDAFDYYADRYDAKKPPSEYMDGRIKVIKLPYSLNFLNKLRKFGGVGQILENERPDLIFVHDIHLNLVEAARYRKTHPECRIIMDYHADYSNSAKNWISLNILHKVIRKSILYRYKALIDRIYPVWPAAGVFLNEVYGIPHEEMELLPHGADTDLANAAKAEHAGETIRRALGIPRSDLVIFTGGKITPAKRTHVLVEAFLAVNRPNVHLMIVGDTGGDHGEYKERLLALCAKSDRIHSVGWLHGADVYRHMNACDFGVFPASQSVLWQQCFSMGLPLIVGEVRNQDARYMNVCGNMVVLDENDITSEKIAQEMLKLIDDPEHLREMQQAALAATDAMFDYNNIVQQTF